MGCPNDHTDRVDPRSQQGAASLPAVDPELSLLRRARAGDEAAFAQLADRHARRLYGLAYRLTGNSADAEDVVQETLLGAFRGLASFRQEASVKTWLTQILVRQAAGHYRKERRHSQALHPGPDEPAFDPPSPPGQVRTDVRMDLSVALGSLSPEHREVIVLRELEDMSYDQIASVLEVPRGTVESRLFRARRELAGRLKEYLE